MSDLIWLYRISPRKYLKGYRLTFSIYNLIYLCSPEEAKQNGQVDPNANLEPVAVVPLAYGMMEELISKLKAINEGAQGDEYIKLKPLFQQLSIEVNDNTTDPYYPIELIILGDYKCGKTSLITQFVD